MPQNVGQMLTQKLPKAGSSAKKSLRAFQYQANFRVKGPFEGKSPYRSRIFGDFFTFYVLQLSRIGIFVHDFVWDGLDDLGARLNVGTFVDVDAPS